LKPRVIRSKDRGGSIIKYFPLHSELGHLYRGIWPGILVIMPDLQYLDMQLTVI
jgi:hypothetical protein